jgi:hypothetical protein
MRWKKMPSALSTAKVEAPIATMPTLRVSPCQVTLVVTQAGSMPCAAQAPTTHIPTKLVSNMHPGSPGGVPGGQADADARWQGKPAYMKRSGRDSDRTLERPEGVAMRRHPGRLCEMAESVSHDRARARLRSGNKGGNAGRVPSERKTSVAGASVS